LRRDLASAPIVSYDQMLGGSGKRAIDLVLTLLALPLWLPIIAVVGAWVKLRHRGDAFQAHERIGYGGRSFKCLSLRLQPPSSTVERLHPPGGDAKTAVDWTEIAEHAEGPRAKWRRALERLPQLFNVVAGDMALVGPSPLSRDQLEPLRTARRYYLSARPGVVGVRAIAADDQDEASQYKIYAMAWSASTDALILWDALRSLRTRGELWKPDFKLAKSAARHAASEAVLVRRRSRGA
jgi:lipopolysaccharide/colanic/teichoic acid biosynthesis glycosyltransferase